MLVPTCGTNGGCAAQLFASAMGACMKLLGGGGGGSVLEPQTKGCWRPSQGGWDDTVLTVTEAPLVVVT